MRVTAQHSTGARPDSKMRKSSVRARNPLDVRAVRRESQAMPVHAATIRWTCASGRHARAHDWTFDGGAVVRASASPLSVPRPFADPAAVDPEEALVAAIASCHMLWFPDLARQAGLQAASCRDAAVGHMEGRPRPWISRVGLLAEAVWTGTAPDPRKTRGLHHAAHEHCFIANSVRSDAVVHPPWSSARPNSRKSRIPANRGTMLPLRPT